jgi:hypothetical protein
MERKNTEGGGVDLEVADLVEIEPWFGYRRADGVAAPRTGTPDDRAPVTVQTVPPGRWSQDHVDRLLLTVPTQDRDTSGLVPIASVTKNLKGETTAVSLRTDAPRFQERLDFRTPPNWNEGAGVALAATLAVEKGHSLGLRHGALQPSDVIVAGSEIAVAGMGLSLGGTPESGLPMAPEVALSGVPTVPGDVYSLGRLLEAGTARDPNTPPEIVAIVADATAEEVGERISTARVLAERLSAAGVGVMRSYAPMGFADSPLFGAAPAIETAVPPVVAARATSAAVAAQAEASRGVLGRALPWLVGAGLAGVIGIGLWGAATSGNGESATTTTATSPTSSTTTETTVDTSTTTASTGTVTTTDTSSTAVTTEPTTTTVPSTTAPSTTVPSPPEVPSVPASEAGLEIIHGLSEPSVDAYLNGDLLVGGFAPGEIAGPLSLDSGDYDLQLFSAVENPTVLAADRTDDVLLAQEVQITGEPEALVVASAGAGGVTLFSFPDALGPIAAGEGRFSVRNPSPSTILVTLDPVTEGASVQRQAIAPGAVLARDLPTGDYQLFITEEDGSPLLASVVSNTEGEVTAATFLRDGSPRLILQRIGGLGTPPTGIPTGASGLLPGSEDPTTGLLVAAAGALGFFALVGRERFVRQGRR